MPIQLAYEDDPQPRRDAPAPSGPTLDFDDVARIASPADNCAIATQDLAAGSELRRADGPPLRLSVGLLEGHRFALTPIAHDAFLLSWGEPFGKALRAIAPGEWLCNAKTLHELRKRQVASALGVLSNFADYCKPPSLSRDSFVPGKLKPLQPELARSAQLSNPRPRPHVGRFTIRHPASQAPGFDGYVRDAGRGCGTRNYLVLLCASSQTNAFARALERRLRGEVSAAYHPLPAPPRLLHAAPGARAAIVLDRFLILLPWPSPRPHPTRRRATLSTAWSRCRTPRTAARTAAPPRTTGRCSCAR